MTVRAPAFAAAPAPARDRVASVDIVRGAVMVLMALDHVRVFSGIPAGGPTAGVFLTRWVGKLVGSTTRELTVTELRDIASAIDGLADLPVERRTIGALRTFLNNTDPEGSAARLRRWERGGPLGWVFDNVIEDSGFGAFGAGGRFVGYDMTDFLDIVSRGRSISRTAQVLYMLAAREAAESRPWPTVPQLAGMLGVRERRVEQCLAELVAAGELVKVSPGVWALVAA